MSIIWGLVCPAIVWPEKGAIAAEEFGRDERIRTSDPHTPSVMRYQAALRPDRRAPNRAMIAPMQGLNRIGARVSSHVLIILPLPPCLC